MPTDFKKCSDCEGTGYDYSDEECPQVCLECSGNGSKCTMCSATELEECECVESTDE